MTPTQKAKELLGWFRDQVAIDYQYDEKPYFENQKNCAIKVCDEVIEQLQGASVNAGQIKYWEKVKVVISKRKK